MTATTLDGKKIAIEIEAEVAEEIRHRPRPHLAVVMAGNNPSSEIYVRNKQRACERVGISSRVVRLFGGGDTGPRGQAEIEAEIGALNDDPACDGILVQMPLPPGLDPQGVLEAISPAKDVDGFSPANVGRLWQGRPRFLPCTPYGIQQLLRRNGVPVEGKQVVVINHTNIVGKPLTALLLQDGATVTVCHHRTPPETLACLCRAADIIVVAVGKPGFLKADMVRPGAVVIDVGISRVGGHVVGDVDESVWGVAGAVSPVPGGVGPLTVAALLVNTVRAVVYKGSWCP